MMETEDEDVVDAPDDVDDDDFSAGESNAQTRQTAQNCRVSCAGACDSLDLQCQV